jgi:hypothetical protein
MAINHRHDSPIPLNNPTKIEIHKFMHLTWKTAKIPCPKAIDATLCEVIQSMTIGESGSVTTGSSQKNKLDLK